MPLELKILLPIGISFYTFQSISYTIDVYRGHIKPEINFILFANYVIFFPQLVAGPILRAGEILWQFREKKIFSIDNIYLGFQRIVFGLFIKIVLADNISKFVDQGFLMSPELLSAYDVLTLSYLFGFQIYFDFSGYSHIAIGCALAMGIKLKENFNFPYHSVSPKIFWKNWHISLSSWVRDYVYLPLLRKKPLKFSEGGLTDDINTDRIKIYSILVLFVTWSIMGLWHGASWNFVFWGIWNFLLVIFFRIINFFFQVEKNYISKILSWFFSLQLIMIGWIFFRSENLSDSFQMLSNFFLINKWTYLSLKENTYLVASIITFFYLVVPLFLKVFNYVSLRSKLLSDLILVISLASSIILILIYNQEINQFIYFQF